MKSKGLPIVALLLIGAATGPLAHAQSENSGQRPPLATRFQQADTANRGCVDWRQSGHVALWVKASFTQIDVAHDGCITLDEIRTFHRAHPNILRETRDANLARLAQSLDGVISVDAKSWNSDTYDQGSINNLKTQMLPNGGGRIVSADLTYNHGTGLSVDVRMYHGQVSCLKYSDNSDCNAVGHNGKNVVGPALVGLAVAAFVYAVVHSDTPLSEQSRGGPGTSTPSSNDHSDWFNRPQPPAATEPEEPPEPEPATPKETPGLYGDCHGGASYGCKPPN